MNSIKFAELLGINKVLEFDPNILVPQARIRTFCKQNICGNYNNHYMCPPLIGTIPQIYKRLRKYRFALLFQFVKTLDVKNDAEGIVSSKTEFHKKILSIENFMHDQKITEKWGLIGGSCALCKVCLIKYHKPCKYPHKARTSLEAIGIDVIELLNELGLDNKFYKDKVIWTGCILYNKDF